MKFMNLEKNLKLWQIKTSRLPKRRGLIPFSFSAPFAFYLDRWRRGRARACLDWGGFLRWDLGFGKWGAESSGEGVWGMKMDKKTGSSVINLQDYKNVIIRDKNDVVLGLKGKKKNDVVLVVKSVRFVFWTTRIETKQTNFGLVWFGFVNSVKYLVRFFYRIPRCSSCVTYLRVITIIEPGKSSISSDFTSQIRISNLLRDSR